MSVSIENLKQRLKEIDKLTDEHWMNLLSERKKKELEFHNSYRNRYRLKDIDRDTYERFYGNKKYYSATYRSKSYVDEWIKQEAKGLIFLDYCCGDGMFAIKAAQAGALMAIGIDLSSISIANARSDAAIVDGAQKIYFIQADAENTMLPDNSINRMVCSGVLHHLDLSMALPEIHRILAPGGKVLVIEALDYNPVIKLYRNLTPQMRTEWEKAHILSMKDLRFAHNFFKIGEIKYWHILGILEPHLRSFKQLLHSIDNVLTRIPLVQLMSWIFTFELIKDEN